jgi:hypothetical protein
MAIEYSEEYVARQYRTAGSLFVTAVLKLFPVIEAVRRIERRVLPSPSIDASTIPPCRVTDALEKAADHFRRHRWAFIEEVFDPAFHRFLATHWPRRRYFTAPFDVHKAYDKGFRWVDHNPAKDRWGELIADDSRGEEYPAFMEEHPHLRMLIDYLRSPAFIARAVMLSDRPDLLQFNRFQLTASYPGTLVAPHRDSPQPVRNWMSFIFYIEGTGGDNSGGTAILRDNEFSEVVFEPKILTNSCLVFDPAAPFYHGVKPIAFGKYRRMLSAEYASAQIVSESPIREPGVRIKAVGSR